MNNNGENIRRWFLAGKYLGKVQQFWNDLDEKVQFEMSEIRHINQLLNNLELRSRRMTVPGPEIIDIYMSDVFLVIDKIIEAEKNSKQ